MQMQLLPLRKRSRTAQMMPAATAVELQGRAGGPATVPGASLPRPLCALGEFLCNGVDALSRLTVALSMWCRCGDVVVEGTSLLPVKGGKQVEGALTNCSAARTHQWGKARTRHDPGPVSPRHSPAGEWSRICACYILVIVSTHLNNHRSNGLVGYDGALTRRRSAVRSRVRSFLFAFLTIVVKNHKRKLFLGFIFFLRKKFISFMASIVFMYTIYF